MTEAEALRASSPEVTCTSFDRLLALDAADHRSSARVQFWARGYEGAGTYRYTFAPGDDTEPPLASVEVGGHVYLYASDRSTTDGAELASSCTLDVAENGEGRVDAALVCTDLSESATATAGRDGEGFLPRVDLRAEWHCDT